MAIDAATLTALAKLEAARLGFALAGVTTPDPPPHLDVYRSWIAAGRHGQMAYLSSERGLERRADPRRILPECESILVVGLRYPPPLPLRIPGARVAAYAQGQDYHDLLPARLEMLVATLQEAAATRFAYRTYTDTGPILERELAQRAGLGWIGKNTCLIHPHLGSYLLLGEALLALPLVPDPPFLPDHCGTCTRCLDACPTGCILPDRTLDAARCVSYLTIELKGSIPTDLRPAVGDWLFGCDVCQEVCPWNRRAQPPSAESAFQPSRAPATPAPADLLPLVPDELRQAFAGTPVLRPKRRGLLRNAAVVAGNQRQASAVPALARALLSESEPLVRAHAAWALGRIGGPPARQALTQALQLEADPTVGAEIQAALWES